MEHLIQLVQDHPALYDTSNEDYMRTKLKDDIWDRIAKELNFTSGKIAKEQWKKLRDCFRDALRRQEKKKSGQGCSIVRPWIYQKQMEFLLPFMSNRSTTSNISSFTESVLEESGDGAEIVDECYLESDLMLEEEAHTKTISKETTADRGKKRKSSELNDILKRNIELYEKRSKSRDEMRKAIIEKQDHSFANNDDPLYQFFISMYNSTKKLPLSYQLRIKRELFNSVTESEEAVLNSDSGSSSWLIQVSDPGTPLLQSEEQSVTMENI